MKLSILIPVFNEHATIREILEKVRAVDIGEITREILVVDDGSTDGTREILAAEEVEQNTTVLYHDVNRGKGAAIRTGLERVTGDYVIIQDADLEYDPDDYRVLLAPVLKKKAEVVYGSRFTGERRNMLFWHMLGNKLLSLVTNILYNTTLSDMETCYKLFSRQALEDIIVKADRFDFEPEITAKILKKGIRIWEVPISYAGREFDEGKKITWKDGFAALWTLIKYRFTD
ncbi:MAG: glycosyltransferase family 2 protein [Actinobacteria bacterium]|nr:glycosyltransferase family 2 protein [Actinomycetota bacterium]MBU1945251.1 glycosyltransferase family 2 protein [Actinomycetota bacterium]MBU2687823.1 glycosyltransferase family 2 protein [Actinomycetota bacterium]